MAKGMKYADKFDKLVESMEENGKAKNGNKTDYLSSEPHKYERAYLYDDRETVRLADAYEATYSRVEGILGNPSAYGVDSDLHEELGRAIGHILIQERRDYDRQALENYTAAAEGCGGLGDYKAGYMNMGLERTLPLVLDALATDPDAYKGVLDTMAKLDIIADRQAKKAVTQYRNGDGWHFLDAPEDQKPFGIGFTGAAYIVGKYKDRIPKDRFVQAFGCDFEGKAVPGVASDDGMRYAFQSVCGIAQAYDSMLGMREAVADIAAKQQARDESKKAFADLNKAMDGIGDRGDDRDKEYE